MGMSSENERSALLRLTTLFGLKGAVWFAIHSSQTIAVLL
jgi:hypothetical protein